MIREPLNSTTIASAGYDLQASTLEIEFRTGQIYLYRGVPETVARGLLAAASPGAWFRRRIRDRYPCQRIDEA